MKLRLWTFDLPLKHVFRISRGEVAVQSTLIAEVEHDGQRGYGEATTSRYYEQTIESMASVARLVADPIASLQADLQDANWPAKVWGELDETLKASRFAQCAVDEAIWDLFGKLRGQKLYELWNADPAKTPISNYTIGLDSLDVMRSKLREFGDWPIFKIKLGTAQDAEILRAMRAETSALLRVDANCGWTSQTAKSLLTECVECGVEFVEQPFPASEIAAAADLKAWSPLPIVADESCVVEADVADCAKRFHGVNIKLMKCGGLTPARRMIAEARKLGLSVMLGCMTESTVGISALAQLAPFVDAVDMDGAVLLAKDIASGVQVVRGKAAFSSLPGSGVALLASPDALGGRLLLA